MVFGCFHWATPFTMPCILKIRVIGARDLPVMDKASDLTDAYVEVRFADFEAQRTTVCRKTLNPVWNEVFLLNRVACLIASTYLIVNGLGQTLTIRYKYLLGF
jgi:Ca2+-dependent lipid-binding protein